jgi:hypothetical protein
MTQNCKASSPAKETILKAFLPFTWLPGRRDADRAEGAEEGGGHQKPGRRGGVTWRALGPRKQTQSTSKNPRTKQGAALNWAALFVNSKGNQT